VQQEWKRAVIKGVPLVHRGEVWLVSSQLKGRLLRERASYKSAIAPTLFVSFVVMFTCRPTLAQFMLCIALCTALPCPCCFLLTRLQRYRGPCC
jgi:hypothetical protein